MCWRCTWPFIVAVDEDTPDESYTSDFKSAEQRVWQATVERTYIPARSRRYEGQ